MKRSLLLAALFSCLALAPGVAFAKSDVGVEEVTEHGPELNPFECYGRYESATGNRTVEQMQIEREKKLDQLDDKDPASVRAMKLCVIARLEARLGDSSVSDRFDAVIEAAPDEPGYELFYGMYYAEQRGARGPILERAEDHFYKALEKLEALKKAGRFRAYHQTVEDWTRKKLTVLYQQDGQALLPFKAFEQDESGHMAPGVSVGAEVLASHDTRDFFYNSEQRIFTGELLFAQSDVRAAEPLTARQKWDLARSPNRLEYAARLRLRHNLIGALDAEYRKSTAKESQIESFYNPTQKFVDVSVEQLKGSYERVFSLYPLFDLRLAGNLRRIERTGAMEFEPTRKESFDGYELRPAVSRFIGTDKVTLEGVYAYFDITDLPGGVPEQALREKLIRSAKLTYSFYSPLTFVALDHGSLEPYRTPTRGLHLFAGAAQDDETYGVRRVTRTDYYGGVALGGPEHYSGSLQVGYGASYTAFVDPNDPALALKSDPTQSFSSLRTNALLERRLVDPEARPGLSDARALSLEMLNVVVPLQWEKALSGPADFENVRGGVELWAKVFGFSSGGTPVLVTFGYDAQYFYNMSKVMHLGHVALRLGWGDL